MIYFWGYLVIGIINFVCTLYVITDGKWLDLTDWGKEELKALKWVSLFAFITIGLWPLLIIMAGFWFSGLYSYIIINRIIREFIEKHVFEIYEYTQCKKYERIEQIVRDEIEKNEEFKAFINLGILNRDIRKKFTRRYSTPLNPKLKITFQNWTTNAIWSFKEPNTRYITIETE